VSETLDPFANDPWLGEQPQRSPRIPKWVFYSVGGCGCAIALFVGVHFAIIAVAAMSYVAKPRAVPGSAVDSEDLEWLREHDVIDADEPVLYLCTSDIPSGDDIPLGFEVCVLTDRRAVACVKEVAEKLGTGSVAYDDILRIDPAEGIGTRSKWRIETVDSDVSHLCAEKLGGGDREFESVLLRTWREVRAGAIAGLSPEGTMSLELQIETLQRFGIELPDGLTVKYLCTVEPREDYEKPPFELLLSTLGDSTDEAEPGSDNPGDVMLLDFDCIEDVGDYTLFAERVRDLADGALPIEDISDLVDLNLRAARLHFELDGHPFMWEAKFDGDMLDPEILKRFAALLAEGTRGVRLASAKRRDDSTFWMVCIERDQLAEFRRQTGVDFEWVE
jgi:hypothetical protein